MRVNTTGALRVAVRDGEASEDGPAFDGAQASLRSGRVGVVTSTSHIRPDEAKLVERVAAGDASAFRLLAERHTPVLLAVARRLLADDAEAEDVVQDGLLRLWRNADGLEITPIGIRPWLRRVVSNLAIDRLRSGRRTEVTDTVPEVAEAATQGADLDARELAARVDAAVAALPERQRLAIALFHFEDMSQRDVAEQMEISEDALESLLARGRRTLKASLAQDWRGLLDDG